MFGALHLCLSVVQHWGLCTPADVSGPSGQWVQTFCSGLHPCWLTAVGQEGQVWGLLRVLWSAPGSSRHGEDLIKGSSCSFALSHCNDWANTAVLVLPLRLRSAAAASLTINGLLINAVKGQDQSCRFSGLFPWNIYDLLAVQKGKSNSREHASKFCWALLKSSWILWRSWHLLSLFFFGFPSLNYTSGCRGWMSCWFAEALVALLVPWQLLLQATPCNTADS